MIRKSFSLILALLLVFSLQAVALAAGEATEKPDENAQGMPLVPDFTLPGVADGEELSLSDLAGKKVVLNFWASWCPPCQQEMPDFQRLYETFAQEGQDVALFSINLADGQQETREKAVAFMEENGYTFPIYFDERGMAFSMFSDGGIPVTAVIDEEGYLMGGALGMTTYENLLKMLSIEEVGVN